MVHNLKNARHLRTIPKEQKNEIEKTIKDKHIFGIDAGKNPPIARIARINMYLHGDGGSRIYFADSLDKKVKVEQTGDPELRTERRELQRFLTEEMIPFDVCLTNPPFSMKKRETEPDQRLILQDYKIRSYTDRAGKQKNKTSLKSNVMFLERYHDILKDGGTLLTVIDESVLNTDSDKIFRDWMLRNYYIKGVFSLPQWAFFEAGSNVKTSILMLEKKSKPSDDQPVTFYGRSMNIGYAMMKQDESKSDLNLIRDAYFKFNETGDVPRDKKTSWNDKSRFFAVQLSPSTRRIDFEWLDPRHKEMDRRLNKIQEKKGYKVGTIGDLISDGICQVIKGKTATPYVSQGMPILKVRNVTNEGINWNTDYVLRAFFDKNPECHLKQSDVLITSTGVGTIGRVAVLDKSIDCMTDGHVTTIRILNTSKLSPDYLAHYLRSIFGQTQIERFTVGSTGQTELNDSDISLIKILYPESIDEQEKVLRLALNHERNALKSRDEYRASLENASQEFKKALMT